MADPNIFLGGFVLEVIFRNDKAETNVKKIVLRKYSAQDFWCNLKIYNMVPEH
jgi:hypothetical protein